MFYKIPMIVISPVYDENRVEIGKQYLDRTVQVSDLNDFYTAIRDTVKSYQSIILYRQDVKRFAYQIEVDNDVAGVFKHIKSHLRTQYIVFKLRHDPRTLEFYGTNTAFIIHQV
jgi:hypothetical protein